MNSILPPIRVRHEGVRSDGSSCIRVSKGIQQPRCLGWIWILLLSGLFAGVPGWAVDVSGVMTTDTTWTTANSPFRVTSHLTVPEGVTLTIEPGVLVEVQQNQGFYVQGEMNAVGVEGSPVRFQGTTASAGWWRGVQVSGGGNVWLEQASIAHGGQWDGVSVAKSGTGELILRNVTVTDGSGEGLRISPGYSNFVSENNRFIRHATGIRIHIGASFNDVTTEFSENGRDAHFDGGALTTQAAWGLAPAYSIHLANHLSIVESGQLIVGAGTRIKPAQNQGIYVSGSLSVNGTEAAPVYFTDGRDDSVGGDTNRDGNETQPGSGWWRGVQVQDGGEAQLYHVVIRYAGQWDGVGIRKTGAGDMTVQNCVVEHTAGDGMFVSNSTSSIALNESIFRNSTQAGLRLESASGVLAIGCVFQNNASYGVRQSVNDGIANEESQFIGNGLASVGVDGGSMTVDRQWGLGQGEEFSIEVIAHINIAVGTTLTLEPGVRVRVRGQQEISVRGEIVAVGTEAQPIQFEGTTGESGWWRGIQVVETGGVHMEYVHMSHAGHWHGATLIKSGSGQLILRNVRLMKGSGDGLRVSPGYSNFVSEHNHFETHTTGVRVHLGTTFDDVTSQFVDNGRDVHCDGGLLTIPVVWRLAPAYSIRLANHLTVGNGGHLAVGAGTRIKPVQNQGIYVNENGGLTLSGTADDPIYLTDDRDDSVGGDANRDGNETTPGAGWWRGVQIGTGGEAQLNHVVIRYAGEWDGVGVRKSGVGDVTLQNVVVENTAGDGMRVENSTANVVLNESVFRNNAQAGLRLQSATVTAIGCVFQDNGSFGVRQLVNDGLVNAENEFIGNVPGSVGVDGGTMTSNRDWDLGQGEGFTIVVLSHLHIEAGTTLTVEPGVIVKFEVNQGLTVEGELTSIGTSAQPIRVEGVNPLPGSWRGIRVINSGGSRLEYVNISHSGMWYGATLIKTGAGQLILRNSKLMDGSGDGLQIGPGYSSFVSENNHFARHGVGLRANLGVSFDDVTSVFVDNARNAVFDGGALSTAATWRLNPAYSIELINHLTIAAPGQLTVGAGTRIKPEANQGIYVVGRLNVQGTAVEPVYFTDGRDDSVGGDSNADGTDSQPAPGWWRGIQVLEGGDALLSHAVVRFAGLWDGVGIRKAGTGDLTLDKVAVEHTAGDGLRVENSTGIHSITDARFVGNQKGVRIEGTLSSLSLTGSFFEGNTGFGVENATTVDVDARNSWWGAASGPLHTVTNPSGSGDRVSDRVLYDPWRTSPEEEGVGQLTVIIEPESVREAGARWAIVEGEWRTSGTSITLPAGAYTITFNTVPGWTSPMPQEVTVVSDEEQSVTATYTEVTSQESTFVVGPALSTPRMGHHGVLLSDGRIALIGGHGSGFVSLNTTEIRNSDGTEPTLLTMQQPRDTPALAQMNDGRYLIVGGSRNLGIPSYATAEIFDPEDNSFTAVGNVVRFRAGSGAAALSDGRVVVAGAWWTHNDAHTYGEIFDVANGTFQALTQPNQARAYPILIPAEDGSAYMLGGIGITGSALTAQVQRFDPTSGDWTTLQDALFPDEPSWVLQPEPRPISAHQLADGRYVYLAYRVVQGTTQYRLVTVDPEDGAVEAMVVTPELPSGADYALRQPVVDAASGRLFLLAQRLGVSPAELSLFRVDIATMDLHHLPGRHTLSPAYTLGGASLTRMEDGRLFLSGGSADGSNFNPVAHTLILTPGEPGVVPSIVLEMRVTGGGMLEMSWVDDSSGEWLLQTSTDFLGWETVTDEPDWDEGRWWFSVPMSDPVRFYRLIRAM